MFTVSEILAATGGKLIAGNLTKRICGVSIDSRTIKPNQLFIAIKGTRLDGHSFIAQAAKNGAGAILFSDPIYKEKFRPKNHLPLIWVQDTVQALGKLAHDYRTRFKIPVIAVTGSNGKTTTKEMLRTIMGERFNVLHNLGTQNNHIGVPLAILCLRKKHDFAVIEIGANHVGEIDWLSWVIQPTVGIITNIGPAHLEFFRSLKGVLQAKLELIKNLAKNGKLIINQDDRFLSKLNGIKLCTITFGMNKSAHFCGEIIERTERNTTFILNKRHSIVLNVLGSHNVYNALASIACARNFGISYKEIKNALKKFQALPLRMQVLNVNNIKIINDCYNANPESLRCVLESLKTYPNKGKKIAVLGDMLELGKNAVKFHQDMGRKIMQDKVDFLITVGKLAKEIAFGAHSFGMPKSSIYICQNCQDAAKFLLRISHPRDIVIVKGSRAMKMERVRECFINSFTR